MSRRQQQRQEYIREAKAAMESGTVDAGLALKLADKLQQQDEFGYAWRLLTLAKDSDQVSSDNDLALKFRQKVTLYTYKDTHLNEEHRLERARAILDQDNHLKDSDNPETLGLAGAIHKRLWQLRSDKRELETSLNYYRRGHEADLAQNWQERGYPGINAAFVLDLLANLEKDSERPSVENSNLLAARKKEAQNIRERLVEGLLPILQETEEPLPLDAYWPIATLAEAYLGLGKLEDARSWLKAARDIAEIPPWQFESTARQLTDLAKLQEFEGTQSIEDFSGSEVGAVLLDFLGDSVEGLKSVYLGKVGLALSGGGFRASLYHIGVLARLAELDQLRHIEVISCVSGGSIIGAYYYLELRKLLQEKLDKDISRLDYIQLVRRVEEGFLKGVQSNIRIRIAAEWTTNLKMIFSNSYSRTQRLGELYEEKLYRLIEDGNQNAPRYMEDLLVLPQDSKIKGEKEFNPRRQNWSRANKVPILVLNATTLNTGHNWQFTASWMGEPPTTVNPGIDANYRLRRLYYSDAPVSFPKVRLGTAVGASSCVPGLFEPVVLSKLYQRQHEDEKQDITVRLVDGGVHDNQGVVGLTEQGCSVMLVSDASGQMEATDNPSKGLISVPLRTNSILMSRVRDAEYTDLLSRLRSSELRELMFVHLKMDLHADPVAWQDSKEPPQPAALAAGKENTSQETCYQINRTVQRLLADNRTDLDAWSDAEAYALMLSGYRMTAYALDPAETNLPLPKNISPATDVKVWNFLQVDQLQKEADKASMFMQILKIGSNTAFKVWRLHKPLHNLGLGICFVAAILLCVLGWKYQTMSLLRVEDLVSFILTVLGTAVFGKLIVKAVRLRETLTKVAFGIGMSLFGFLVARVHLHLFNPLYLRLGKVNKSGELGEQ